MQLDHLILSVNDRDTSLEFYSNVLGFAHAGEEGPFAVVRVSDVFVLLMFPGTTEGGTHLAFAMTKAEFDQAFDRIKASGVAYGSHFHDAANLQGPAPEFGARGATMSVYLYDPNQHLIEILYYED